MQFASNELKLASDFGDIRLDGKKWSDLQGDAEIKKQFWNYQITVELIDVSDGDLVNEVFDRLNRNARKLTNQELRHAKYDGWFVKEAEQEATREDWRKLGITTPARSKRMADVQFISELMLVVLQNKILGFDQDALDAFYAKYDDPGDTDTLVDTEEFQERFGQFRDVLVAMDAVNGSVSNSARALGNIYSLWGVLVLADALPSAIDLATKYQEFMRQLAELSAMKDPAAVLHSDDRHLFAAAFHYLTNLRGANTDLTPRLERHDALKIALLT